MRLYLDLLGALLITGAAAGCGASNTRTEAAHSIANQQQAESASPVQLVQASIQKNAPCVGGPCTELNVQILVQSLAYDKSVSVALSAAGATWQSMPAHFVTLATGGFELWQADSVSDLPSGQSMPSLQPGQKIDLAVEYTVNGQDYWDNNGGSNYSVVADALGFGATLGGQTNVILASTELNQTRVIQVGGTVVVRNLSPNKQLTVVYSSDGWWHTQTSPASYAGGTPGSNAEVWGFELSAIGLPVQFSLAYSENGQTFWDNNYGRNYTVQ